MSLFVVFNSISVYFRRIKVRVFIGGFLFVFIYIYIYASVLSWEI